MSKNLIFFGNERLSAGFSPQGSPTLQSLIDAGYNVKAVVAHHGQTHSRAPRELEIEQVAKTNDIPVLLPDSPSNIKDELANYGAGAAVLAAYGKIIPSEIIGLFPWGIINIHPSLLPLYRGPTPIEQAIRDGVATTGVSLMRLTSEMDKGPVFDQAEIPLSGDENKQHLTARLLKLGGELLVKNLPAILDGSLTPKVQDEALATYTPMLTKKDAWLDLSQPAASLERQVRAFSLWPKSKLQLGKNGITVLQARVVPAISEGKLVVACGAGSFLEITRLIAPSGKTMTGADFIRGYGV